MCLAGAAETAGLSCTGGLALAAAGVGTAGAGLDMLIHGGSDLGHDLGSLAQSSGSGGEGYTSSPALKGDPYHPDEVAERSAGNQELYAPTPGERAASLGYETRIPAQRAPFNSHNQEVFWNGSTYITPDVDGHNVSNGWKMFNRRGVRIGTYDADLNYVKE